MGPLIAAEVAAAPAAAATAAATTGGGLAALIKTLGLQTVTELLAQKAAGAFGGSIAPSQYVPASVGENKSNYFIGANPYIAREEYEAGENYKRAILRKFGIDLPNVTSTKEVIAEIEKLTEKQAQSLSARERQKISLEGSLAQQLAALQGEIGLKRAELERGYDVALKGYDLEEVKQKAIGDIEKQKYSSAYDAAKTLLNSTIDAISGPGPYANNPDLRQVATPV